MKTKYFLIFLTLLSFISVNAQKKPFTIETLYKVKSVGSPVASPDGKLIALTVATSDFKKGKSNADIYLMDREGKNLTPVLNTSKSEYSPMWISENEFIFFQDGNLFRYSVSDKKTEQLTDLSIDISNPILSADNKHIAFEANIYPECGTDDECNKRISNSAATGPVQAYIADELMYRHWTSFDEEKEPHVFILSLEDKKLKDVVKSKLVSSNFMLGAGIKYNFSPDGKEIAYVSTTEKNIAASTNWDIYTIDLASGKSKLITADNKAWDGDPSYSPDGKYIGFKMHKIKDFESDRYRIAIYDRTSGKIEVLTEDFDYTIDDFFWSNDSKSIYFNAQVKGYMPVYRIDVASKKIEQLTENTVATGLELIGNELFFNHRLTHLPSEIYKINLNDRKLVQLTNFNKELLDEYDFRPAEQMWVKGAEGIDVHVFIVKPHNFDPKKKYPLILNVHGGPQSQWMDAFRGDWQVYPGSGYVVAFANPHGSTGYGSKYTEAISGDYGGKVYEDLMKVTDELERLPYVDKERIGAMGWSFGGYMMNWFQAQTKRYKCLASMMGLYDLESMWGATEELWFVNWDLKGEPWKSDNYEKYSPSNYVKNFSTPTLIITGERDYRVPYTQSVQYFTTLQTLGIDSRLIIFENDGHWPSNTKSMPLYYNAHLEWFHKYLGGDPAPYDSKKLVKNTQFE